MRGPVFLIALVKMRVNALRFGFGASFGRRFRLCNADAGRNLKD
jgi:hypothetical protein